MCKNIFLEICHLFAIFRIKISIDNNLVVNTIFTYIFGTQTYNMNNTIIVYTCTISKYVCL